LLKQAFRPVEQARAQVVLRQPEERLLAVLGSQPDARQEILVDADGALDLAAPSIQGAQGKMRLYGVRIRVHELQEHVERPVGLLGDEVIESGQIVRVQLAQGTGPALSPAEVAGQYPQHQGRDHQNPSEERQVGHRPTRPPS